MIHRAIREMIIEEAGQDAWQAIEASACVGPAEMISAVVYDDEVTVRILLAASVHMKRSPQEYLESFGEYWIGFAARCPYGSIMNFTGHDIVSFIGNLDQMHTAVISAMPQARVPSFLVIDALSGSIRVRYQSDREGLEPFVTGLLRGVLRRFDLAGEVECYGARDNSTEFQLRYQPAASAP